MTSGPCVVNPPAGPGGSGAGHDPEEIFEHDRMEELRGWLAARGWILAHAVVGHCG